MTVQAHTVDSDIFDDIPNPLCLAIAMTLKLHGSFIDSFSVHFSSIIVIIQMVPNIYSVSKTF